MESSSVDKIKERLSIVDVVSSYISLTQAGKNYKARCPFHNEKTPSFFVSPERRSYYCFGCGAKGDIFSFVEHFEGTDFLGALKLLAKKAGVTLEKRNFSRKKDNREKLYQVIEEATVFFESIFNKENAARTYLKNRGISDRMIKLFRIGYAPDSWQSVSVYLLKKGFTIDEINEVGLIKKKQNDNFYDRFRNRIIFPINDSSGRVIAFSGRILGKDNKREAKYLNSPETPLFNKSDTLFGIDKAKVSIKKRDYTIIVEGQLDLILSHQIGFTNTVAVSGTAFSDKTNELKVNNLGLIRRLSSNIIFAFDGDEAGIRATDRSSLIALSLDMQVKIAIIPEAKDPADIISKNIDEWKGIVKNSVGIVDFHLNTICQSTDDLHSRGKKVREIIFPFLSMIKSSIEKSSYINLIYRKTGISESAIAEDFENYKKNKNFSQSNNDKKVDNILKSRRERLEERLFGIISWQADFSSSNDINNSLVKIKELLNNFEEKIGKENFDKMKEKYESNSSVLAFEAEIWYGNEIDKIIRDLDEITFNLEEEILKEKLTYLQNEINQKEASSSEEEISLILKDYQKIVERIQKIKKHRAQ